MNDKLKKIFIPFILMVIFDLGFYFTGFSKNLGGGLNPHVGLFFISGLLFGPYGAAGVVLGNMLCDFIRGYNAWDLMLSAVISFAVSCLSYRLWYEQFRNEPLVKPRITEIWQLAKILGILFVMGILYVYLLNGILLLTDLNTSAYIIGTRYFFNYLNFSIIFGIVGLWASNRIDFIHFPKTSEKLNKRFYLIVEIFLAAFSLIFIVVMSFFNSADYSVPVMIITIILIYMYLTKPNPLKIPEINHSSITGEVIERFLLGFLIFIIINVAISYWIYVDYRSYMSYNILSYEPALADELSVLVLATSDFIVVLFCIPSFIVLSYVRKNVVNPIVSFSEIENFVMQGEKIESEGLIDIYSHYVGDKNEIGILARSYTDLIRYNNYYIENINKIENEKERIKTELYIATKIQQSNLPTSAIENEFFKVNGYSHPAKEVGGDFFDYYELDEDNLAIIIGDASGKGVPAALLATITQSVIKQLLKHESDPSKILHTLNNQLCENNSEFMFITLWLGIYNRASKTLTFSNAGHNPPLVKSDDRFEYLQIDEGIVLGIMEDFEFTKEEIVLTDEIITYTDGITDANTEDNEMYGEDRLKMFFNNFKSDEDPIKPLLDDINGFVGDYPQFDDMTISYLKIKN